MQHVATVSPLLLASTVSPRDSTFSYSTTAQSTQLRALQLTHCKEANTRSLSNYSITFNANFKKWQSSKVDMNTTAA